MSNEEIYLLLEIIKDKIEGIHIALFFTILVFLILLVCISNAVSSRFNDLEKKINK